MIAPLFAQAVPVAEDIAMADSAYALEIGGLMFLIGGVIAILFGLMQGGDEHASGSRAIGYGVAMAVSACISLYLSVQLGGDPTATAVNSTWLYAVGTVVACMLYIRRTINQAKRRGTQRATSAHQRHASRSYTDTLATRGRRPQDRYASQQEVGYRTRDVRPSRRRGPRRAAGRAK